MASEKRISTTKVFRPTIFTIDGHEFTDLQFRVLPHFKGSDSILGLPALKKLEVVIHPNLNSFTMGDYTIQCNRESRRISCLIVDTDKMNKLIAKLTRKNKDSVDVFLISLHFTEELASVKVILENSLTNNRNMSSRSLRMLRRDRKGCHLIGGI